MTTEDAGTPGSGPVPEPAADADRNPSEKFRHLPPAVALAATVAVVGVVPQVPLGPEGAGGDGGDGD